MSTISAAEITGLTTLTTSSNTVTFGSATFFVANGNMGIGTSSPSKKFVVSSAGAAGFEISPNESSSNAIRLICYNRSTSAYVVGALEGSTLTFSTTTGVGLNEAMRIDSSGNVGIGTTSPASYGKLAIVSPSQYAPAAVFISDSSAANWARTDWKNVNVAYSGIIYQDQSGLFNIRNDGANAIAFSTNGGIERMRITSTGNVGINCTPSSDTTYKWLNIYGPTTSGGGIVQLNNSDASVGINMFCNNLAGYMGTSTAHPLLFRINSSEVARFNSNGNLLINWSAAASYKLFVSADSAGTDYPACFNNANTGSGNQVVVDIFRNNTRTGYITNTNTTTAFTSTSDYRLKENVQPMTGALAKVALLKPVIFNWKVDGSKGQGFIAHELAEVVSDCVSGEKDGIDSDGNPSYQGVDTSFLVATLTAAIQELKAELDQLKNNK